MVFVCVEGFEVFRDMKGNVMAITVTIVNYCYYREDENYISVYLEPWVRKPVQQLFTEFSRGRWRGGEADINKWQDMNLGSF